MSSRIWKHPTEPPEDLVFPITMPSRAALTKLAVALAKVAAAGALTAAIAYTTDHQAENPALFMALAFALREADHALTGK